MSKRKLGSLLIFSPIIIFVSLCIIAIVLSVLIPSIKTHSIAIVITVSFLVVLSLLVGIPFGIVKILNSESKGTFDIREINGFSWSQTKKQFWMLFLFMLTYFGINIILGQIFDEKSWIGSLISLCVSVIFSIGIANVGLVIANGHKVKYLDFFEKIKYFFHFLGSYILYVLIIFGGLILLILPGIYWATRFSFYPYLILEKKMNPIKALKESWAITKGRFWDVFAYNLLLGLINILGFICLIIGLLWTLPMTMIAKAKMYKALSK